MCVAIKVNDDIGRFFHARLGLREDGPIRPILFTIVTDMLAILIEQVKVVCQKKKKIGCVPAR
jgi:hypothetical protein